MELFSDVFICWCINVAYIVRSTVFSVLRVTEKYKIVEFVYELTTYVIVSTYTVLIFSVVSFFLRTNIFLQNL